GLRLLLVTRRVGVIPAGGAVVRRRRGVWMIVWGGCRRGCRWGGRGIPGRASRGTARDAGKRQWRPGHADDVDENGSGSVGARQVSLQNLHVERQPIAGQIWGLQDNDRIADSRTVLAEHRNGRVGRILSKAVATSRPFLEQVRSKDVPCRPHRTVSEDDGVRRHSDQGQLLTLQAGTACVQNNQRRHDFRLCLSSLRLPYCFLQGQVRWSAARCLSKPQFGETEQTQGSHEYASRVDQSVDLF